MQNHNEHKEYTAEQIGSLIRLLNSEEPIAKDTRAEIDRLLLSGCYNDEVTEALAAVWDDSAKRSYSSKLIQEEKQKTLVAIAKKCDDFPVKPAPTVKAPQRTPLYKRTMFRVAAVLVPLLVLGGAIGLWLSGSGTTGGGVLVADNLTEAPMTITVTATESERLLKLSDGSSVRLEPGATLEYGSDFPENRIVKLTGNAFFTVAKMDGKTFEVLHNDMTIRVLGTEFYVCGRDTATEVTLCSGSVEIEAAGRYTLLEPNQQFVCNNRGEEFSVHELTNAEIARINKGKLQLREVPLAEALQRVGEFFGMEIEILSAGNTEPITIEFSVNDELEEILFVLRAISDNAFSYEIQEGKVVIRR